MVTPNSDAIETAKGNLVEARNELVTEIARLQAGVDQIDSFLSTFGDAPAPAVPTPPAAAAAAAPAAPPRGRPKGSKNKPKPATAAKAEPAAAKRAGRPRRGAITEAIIKYLDSRAPNAEHADAILSHLETVGAAPQSANPKPTLQSTLNRLASQKQVSNIGRNRWRRTRESERNGGGGEASPAAVAAAPQPVPAPAEPASAPAAGQPSAGQSIEQAFRSSETSRPAMPRFGGAPQSR